MTIVTTAYDLLEASEALSKLLADHPIIGRLLAVATLDFQQRAAAMWFYAEFFDTKGTFTPRPLHPPERHLLQLHPACIIHADGSLSFKGFKFPAGEPV